MSSAAKFNSRDRSRTTVPRAAKLVTKYKSPPANSNDQEGNTWAWLTEEMLTSPAFTSLSGNANRAFFRIIVEFLQQGRTGNGQLIVTHADFNEYGVNPNYVADAIDELQYKGLIKVRRGRSAEGASHPNRYRLTYLGADTGAAWTNEWRGCTHEHADNWPKIRKELKRERRRKIEAKRKSPLTDSLVSHSRNDESATDLRDISS